MKESFSLFVSLIHALPHQRVNVNALVLGEQREGPGGGVLHVSGFQVFFHKAGVERCLQEAAGRQLLLFGKCCCKVK